MGLERWRTLSPELEVSEGVLRDFTTEFNNNRNVWFLRKRGVMAYYIYLSLTFDFTSRVISHFIPQEKPTILFWSYIFSYQYNSTKLILKLEESMTMVRCKFWWYESFCRISEWISLSMVPIFGIVSLQYSIIVQFMFILDNNISWFH